MATNISINHPVFPGRQIPVIECTIDEGRQEKIITAFVSTDAEMLRVYKTLFLNCIVRNQASRFVCVRSPDFEVGYIEVIAAEQTNDPHGVQQRVLCIYPPHQTRSTQNEEESKFSMGISMEAAASDNPERRGKTVLQSNRVTIEQAQVRLDEGIVINTTLGCDRLVYRMSMTQTSSSAFSSNSTKSAIDYLGNRKMKELVTQTLPPVPHGPLTAEDAALEEALGEEGACIIS
jgi:hypothetical protein